MKPLVFTLCLLPLAWLGWAGMNDGLGANPIEFLIRTLGDWALRMLLVALAVTPMRQLTGWGWIGRLRRMLGLFAFAYALLHVAAWIGVDQFLDWGTIGREIAKRRYILVGMSAFVILIALASTSTNGMIRRLGGRRWRLLHKSVYAAGILASLHYLMMVKVDIRPPLGHIVILALLLGWRVIKALPAPTPSGRR